MSRTSTLAALVLSSAVVLAACGSDDDPADSATEPAGTSTSDAGGDAGCTAVPPAAADGTPLAPADADTGVEVSGSLGEAPTIAVPDSEAPAELVIEVLEEGDGETVAACDFVSVDYYGQKWVAGDDTADNVFDQSFERGDQFRTTLGVGAVIQGWDAGLAGVPVGSRVLLSIPPEFAYGTDAAAHELGGETLLFVVDVVDRVAAGSAISGEAVADLPEGLPAVSGDGAEEEPTIDFTGAEAPDQSDAVLLVAGDGPEILDNIVVKMLQAPYGDGTQTSTWAIGQGPLGRWPNGAPVTVNDLPGLAEALDGQRVGSRVLVRVGSEDNLDDTGAGAALAIVVDVIGTYANPA